jgi:DNA-binding protein HU-beta
VTESITEALASGEKVQVVGFGSFEVRKRPARVARNPRTGEQIKIAASKAPVFKAGKALKDRVSVSGGIRALATRMAVYEPFPA